MNGFVYDAAVLIAADRNDRPTWAEHKARLEFGFVPWVPSPVVAQASRSPAQAPLRRMLRGCDVVPLTERHAHEAGRLLGATRTSDVVDAAVVVVAAERDAVVLTGDSNDLTRLARASGRHVSVIEI